MPSPPKPAAPPRVAALFVTMNRCATALVCLERLAAQTRRPDGVFVIDNASTDNTAEKIGALHSNLTLSIQVLPENLGNAGGMEIGMDAAFKAGFDAVWILDDDSWPEPEALEELLAVDLPPEAVRSSRVINQATGNLSWPLHVRVGRRWRLFEGADPLPDEPVLRIRRSWLGALIPRLVYHTVGPVDGRLFLRGEDEDYPRRIERAGFPVFMVSNSRLHHPPACLLGQWRFAGRTVVLESGLSADKLYYRLRNICWITRRDHGIFEALVTALLIGLALIRWENSARAWFPVWWEAARDAFQGRLGKRGA